MSAVLELFSEGIKLIGIVCGFVLVFQAMNIVKMKALSRRIDALNERLSQGKR
jgi:hypothetical protein